MKINNLIPLPVLALAGLLFAAVSGSAQVLLTASNYALLGATAITVGGPGPNPIVNGNVGLSAAATTNITGFPPAVVSGNTLTAGPAAIIPTGGATGQAGADLITARNALFAMPQIPANDLSNLDFGTLAALRPGVYFSTSAVNQTGAIVLDANFQNGVAWVFNMSLSLTTAANSTVTFINLGTNGGSDNGLFWNAATAISVGDNNTILGNYMAGTSISFTGITNTLATGGVRALAGAAVSFAGPAPAGFNTLGGPGGGDFDGGLMYNGLGQLVVIPPPVPPIVPPVIPPAPVFTGNVILSSTGSFAPGTSGVILVPGTSLPTSTLTLDGNSSNGSAPASLTINTATVTLTGTSNTYTGGTIVNTGALIATSQTLPVNGPIALNTSILTFNQPVTGSFGGVISGNGSVNKQGVGTTTLTGANTYTGGTTVTVGTLVASTSTLPVNGRVAVLPVATLVFNQAANGSFGGAITGGGKVQKTGTGSLTLTTATTSPVDVQAGSFFFSNGIGATTVSSGATLGGTGNVIGLLTNNGTVSPGTSPGTINVTGNYIQPSSGKLIIEIASATSFDKLLITGTASLAGTLQVDTLGGYNPIGQSFTFLTASSVSGTFGTLAGLVSGSAATAATVTYAPTSATVTFSQLPFAGFGVTPNQQAVGGGAQLTPEQAAALNTLPQASQFPAALNAISPQGYQVWSDYAFAHSTSLADRLLRDDRAVSGHDEYYFEAGQIQGRSRSDLDVGSSRYTTSQGLVGGNHAINPNTTLGAFFGFGKTIGGLGSVGSQTTVKDKTLGLRAGWADGPLFAEALLAYSWNRYESTRPVVFPGTTALATSSAKGHQWTTGMTVGKHFKAGVLTVSPFGGLLLSRWTANSFTEQGAGAFSANVGRQSATSLRSQLGAEARVKLGMFQPHVRAAWLHEFYNDSRRIGASFGNASYSVRTRRAPRDSALYSAGVDMVLGPNALIYTSVSSQSGGTTRVLNEWNAGVSITF